MEPVKKYHRPFADNTIQSGGFLHLRQKIKKYLEKGCCAKILSVKALNPLRRSRARFPLLSPAVTSSPGAGEVFPQRESQGLRLVAKVLGVMGKFPATQKSSPLGGAGIAQR